MKNCYPSFTAQFDQLLWDQVIWEPYTEDVIATRFHGGISAWCERDREYWLTRSKIMFDVFVEEMSQQRVMRQFGFRQAVVPPRADVAIPSSIHRYDRLIVSALIFFQFVH